jgi:hypothetical protein
MANGVHRPLNVIAFNANGIGRQSHEVSKQLQDLRIDVAVFSETHLKPQERFYIRNYHFYRNDRHPGRKGGTAVAVRRGIPHMPADLPPLLSVEATGVCIPIGKREVLLAAVYRCPERIWTDADITELLSFRDKWILAGDLNSKLLQLFHISEFEISAPQCPTHYSHEGNGDVLNIVVHKNIRLSDVSVSDILDSDHLPILFHILDHVRTNKISDWERFQSLASNLISPRTEIKSGVEADKAARDFTASVASAYRLSASKIILSGLNNDLPGLDRLLKYKKKMRKL